MIQLSWPRIPAQVLVCAPLLPSDTLPVLLWVTSPRSSRLIEICNGLFRAALHNHLVRISSPADPAVTLYAFLLFFLLRIMCCYLKLFYLLTCRPPLEYMFPEGRKGPCPLCLHLLELHLAHRRGSISLLIE